jgi:hypothetical protein
LYALKAWRDEIYGSPQPSGQAARYWHAELRQVLQAAGVYAAGCRTGHRGAPHLAAADAALREHWAHAYSLAGVPGVDIAAGHAKRTGALVSTAAIAQALDNGDAMQLPGLNDFVIYAGACWAPGGSGWVRVPVPDPPAQMNGTGTIGGTERWEY